MRLTLELRLKNNFFLIRPHVRIKKKKKKRLTLGFKKKKKKTLGLRKKERETPVRTLSSLLKFSAIWYYKIKSLNQIKKYK